MYPDGSRVSYLFDSAGEQTAVGDITGWTTTLNHAAGRTVGVTSRRGKILTYSRDPSRNPTGLVDPDGGVMSTICSVESSNLSGKQSLTHSGEESQYRGWLDDIT